MRRKITLALAILSACSDPKSEPAEKLTPLVDVFTGTGGLGFTVGSLLPGPMYPFAMARPGPDTSTRGGAPNFSHCGGYWYEDDEIRGFSQLHLSGTGVPDYGVLMVMPVLDFPSEGPIRETDYRATLDHDREFASVGSYRVTLLPSRIKVEIGATPRTAIYRVTYPEGQVAQNLVLNLAHGINGETHSATIAVDAANGEISGEFSHEGEMVSPDTFEVYFVLKADRPFKSSRDGEQAVVVGLDTSAGTTLNFQIGLSFVDVASARKNLEAEWMNYDVAAAQAAALAAWETALAPIRISGGSEAHRKRFYTALYDLQQMPTLLTESDGNYRGLDKKLYRAEGFTYYTDFSLWDTFRTFHPLMTLLRPDIQTDFMKSMLAMTEHTGRIPKWPLATVETDTMIGYHGETVLVDSYLKGVGGLDGAALYARLRAAAFMEPDSRRKRDCINNYLSLGYCAADHEGGSASKTLENAFSDFVLGQLATEQGASADAALLETRARSWSALINPETGVIQGKNADGSFTAGFTEEFFADEFVEGNARQWTTYVPHDIAGLADSLGGRERYTETLERFFENSAAAEKTVLPDLYYWHGNEPDIHAAYMFAELGRSELTERWVHWIMENRYANDPDGLDGNDDGGTLSAWYVFSALGFYPKLAESRYVLGRPLFETAEIQLPAGTLTIRANNLSDEAIYVRSASFNGTRLTEPFLTHDQIKNGGELVFEMSTEPVSGAY